MPAKTKRWRWWWWAAARLTPALLAFYELGSFALPLGPASLTNNLTLPLILIFPNIIIIIILYLIPIFLLLLFFLLLLIEFPCPADNPTKGDLLIQKEAHGVVQESGALQLSQRLLLFLGELRMRKAAAGQKQEGDHTGEEAGNLQQLKQLYSRFDSLALNFLSRRKYWSVLPSYLQMIGLHILYTSRYIIMYSICSFLNTSSSAVPQIPRCGRVLVSSREMGVTKNKNP
jgi:hypothetical protein